MAEAKKGLVTRDKKVAFMAVAGATDGTYTRMTKFTEMSKSSNANEYSRKYVDQPGEDSDVTGYSPSYSYAFDQYVGNAVHDDIVKITDNELVGDEAVRVIVVVDFTQPGTTEGQYKAKKREYSVIPDSDGDDENTYTYSGDLKSKGVSTDIVVSSTDGWKTCTEVTGS